MKRVSLLLLFLFICPGFSSAEEKTSAKEAEIKAAPTVQPTAETQPVHTPAEPAPVEVKEEESSEPSKEEKTSKEEAVKRSPVSRGITRISADTRFSFNRISGGGSSLDTYSIATQIDRFILDHFSVGPAFLAQISDGSTLDSTLFFMGGAVAGSWHVLGKLIPFVRVSPGLGFFDTSATDVQKQFALGLDGGIDFQVTDTVAVGLSFGYMRIFSDPAVTFWSLPLRFALYL